MLHPKSHSICVGNWLEKRYLAVSSPCLQQSPAVCLNKGTKHLMELMKLMKLRDELIELIELAAEHTVGLRLFQEKEGQENT